MNYTYTTRSMAHCFTEIENYVPNGLDKDGNYYDTFNKTLEEALKDVDWWRTYADSVGGDACVVRSDEKLYKVPYNIDDFPKLYPELYN